MLDTLVGEKERENFDEDALTTGNLVVLQLEFPFSLLVGFICIDVSSEVVCFWNKGGWRTLSAFEITSHQGRA